MGQKVRHIVRFEKEDEIFDGIDGDAIADSVENELPDEVSVGKCYCEYPKPYGHQPYASIVTVDGTFMVDDVVERAENIESAVREGVTSVVGSEIDEMMSEGWA